MVVYLQIFMTFNIGSVGWVTRLGAVESNGTPVGSSLVVTFILGFSIEKILLKSNAESYNGGINYQFSGSY
jgi:hypothetical protein